MKKFFFAVFTLLLTSAACAQEAVSMIELIATPNVFEGKKVRVVGYYDISVDNALFVTKDSSENLDLSSSISVIDESSGGEMTGDCFGRYVEIEGTIELDSDGYHQITNVNHILDIKKNRFCWERDYSQ